MKNHYILAVISGLLLGLGWPTYGFPILLFAAFVPLLMAEKMVRNSNQKRRGLIVFFLSYITFVLWNACTTWWIVYATAFGMAFAILANSLFMAFVFLLYHYAARRVSPKIHLLFLPALWLAFEKLHLSWDLSWPWLSLGNAFSESTRWIQWYEYTGVLGGSLWIWIVNIGIFKTIDAYRTSKNRKTLTLGLAKNALFIAIPIIISFFILLRYREPDTKVNVVLLQPNTDPYTEKYYDSNEEVAARLFALANEKVTQQTDFVIAPETVFARNMPLSGFSHSSLKYTIEDYVHQYKKLNFLSGISFIEWMNDKDATVPESNQYNDTLWYNDYNAAFLVNQAGNVQHYYKSKLVVGVENFPFKSILEPLLGDIMIDMGGTVATKITQKERTAFTAADGTFRAGPIICYESVYGEFVTGYVKKGANFLAIITNDGWWSDTQGHQQHLSYARLRSIETRRSIARSANTGISAFINPKGEILSLLPYNTQGALSGSIAVNDRVTFYVKHGDYIGRIAYFTAGLLLLVSFTKRRR